MTIYLSPQGPFSHHQCHPYAIYLTSSKLNLSAPYLSGIICSDGTIPIYKPGEWYLEAALRVHQSNLSFLNATNEVFDDKGIITIHSAADTCANVIEGRCSKAEMRQMLTFVGKAAGELAAQLEPYTVTQAPHIEALWALVHLPADPSEAKKQLYYRMQRT